MSQNKCFLCSGEIQNGISSCSEENYTLLCQILELSGENGTGTEELGGKSITYCQVCLNRILNIRDMLEELERLEKKVRDEKYSIELQLKEKKKSQGQNSSDQLSGHIVAELQAASIGSMLEKIRKKRVDQCRKGSSKIRIMKSVTIPKIVCERIQPISQDQVQTGEVMVTSQESQPQLVHQHSVHPNPQSGDTNNDHLKSQRENGTCEEPLTASANVAETSSSRTSDNEELDTQHEILSDSEMIIDHVQLDQDQLDFPQQNGSNAQLTPPTEDGPSGAGVVSHNQSKNIDRKRGRYERCWPCMRKRKCDECGKVLSSKFTLTSHVMSFHRRQYKFKCTVCNYGSQQKVRLREHIENVHGSGNVNS